MKPVRKLVDVFDHVSKIQTIQELNSTKTIKPNY